MKYLRSFLGAAALALSIGAAKPMMITFDANTGCLLGSVVYTPSMVNIEEFKYVRNITQMVNTSANMQILSNGQGGKIILYAIWQ